MSDIRTGVLSKVARAQYHFADLKERFEVFRDSEPYMTTPKMEGDQCVITFNVVHEPPPGWAFLSGDTVHCYRSALAPLALSLLFPHPPAPGPRHIKDSQFPIADDSSKF